MRRMVNESQGIFKDAEKIAIQSNYETNHRLKRDLISQAREKTLEIIQNYLDNMRIDSPEESFDAVFKLKKYTSSPVVLSTIEAFKDNIRHSIRVRNF